MTCCWPHCRSEACWRRGKHRTDSTHVISAVRNVNRVELAGECVRAALEALAVAAPGWVRQVLEVPGRTPLRPELGRAHLLYGEWLRRDNRRVDARHQLKIAHEMFADLGMRAFAGRARRELVATGERVRQSAVESESTLTAQETLIVRLASDGLTNSEIGAQLFLSARTVEWHLRNVFGKLGITSRRRLAAALNQNGDLLDR